MSSRVTPRGFFDSDWPVILLLAIATFLVFAPAIGGQFLSWDDTINLSKNPRLNPPSIEKNGLFWKNPYLNLYIPVTYTAWSVLSAAVFMDEPDSGGNSLTPGIFHVANVSIHLIAVLTVYALLEKLVRRRWAAAAGALLFAIHPLQVEPVAWMTGLKDVLSGALAMVALWQYIAFADDRPPTISSRWRRVHYALAVLAYLVAMLAKPSAIIVPLAAFVLDRWVVGRPWKKSLLAVLPMLPVMTAAILFSRWVQPASVPADGGHVLLRPLVATDAVAFYLYKLFFPLWLGFHYARSPLTVIHNGAIYWTWLAPAALIAAIALFRKRSRWLFPAAALFVGGVAPVLGLVPFDYQHLSTVADRYVYVSMLGPAFALAAILAKTKITGSADRRIQASSWRNVIAVVAIVLGVLATRSFAQAFVWRNTRNLADNGLAVNPRSSIAFVFIGMECINEKRYLEARADANRAIELAPQNADGYVLAGTIDNLEANPAAAVAQFNRGLSLAPFHPDALCGLGEAFLKQGKLADAQEVLHKAIAGNFEMAHAHELLATVSLRLKLYPEAFNEARFAVALDPGDAQAQYELASLLHLMAGDNRANSLRHLKIALKIEPDLADAKELYRVLMQENR